MTLDRQPYQNYRLLEPCECVDLCDIGEVPFFYNPIEPEIQPKPCPVQSPDVHTAYHELRQRAFERLLNKLSGKQLLGSHHAERYLRDQYRRGCRPNTMRSSWTAIELFLSFITATGKPHLYRQYLKRRNCSNHTVKNYMNTLRHFVLWLDVPVEEVTHKKIQAYIDRLRNKRLAPKTINCHLDSIRGFYDYLRYEEEIPITNPVKRGYAQRLSRPLPRYLKNEEVVVLLNAIHNRPRIRNSYRPGARWLQSTHSSILR